MAKQQNCFGNTTLRSRTFGEGNPKGAILIWLSQAYTRQGFYNPAHYRRKLPVGIRRHVYKTTCARKTVAMDTFTRLTALWKGDERQHKESPDTGRLTPAYTQRICADKPVKRPKRTQERQPTGVTQPSGRPSSHPKGHAQRQHQGTPPTSQTP